MIEARNVFSWLDDIFVKPSVTNSISAVSFDVLNDSYIYSVLRDKMVGFEDLYVSVVPTKCLPILLYGICSLHLSSMSLSSLSFMWNTALRWIFGYGKN